jgi:hypothetical protein
MPKQYSPDDFICTVCIDDALLKTIVRDRGNSEICALCGKENNAISIGDLAAVMYPVVRRFYVQGANYLGTPEGDDLSWVVQDLLGQCLECEDCLIDALCDADPADLRHGEEPFLERDGNYKNKPSDLSNYYYRWGKIRQDLKTRRRFFNEAAKEFFDSLFVDLEHAKAPADPTRWDPDAPPVPVVRTMPAGTTIYRGRICYEDTLVAIVKAPEPQLGVPPLDKARAGRMNSEGIRVFYGALEEDTCVAELRPSIGGLAIVGRFSLQSDVRMLDFRLLDDAYPEQPTSPFQKDAEDQYARREFVRRIHRLIADPVAPGREHEYLITQCLAEYLSHVRKPGLDGLVFESTQRENGANIVLFPTTTPADEGEETRSQGSFPVQFLGDRPNLFRTERVFYKTKPEKYSVDDNGVRLASDYEEDES